MKRQAYRMSCSLNTNAYTRLSGGTIGGVINEVMDVKPTVVETEEPVVAEIPASVVKQ